jgi:hypothetical protein
LVIRPVDSVTSAKRGTVVGAGVTVKRRGLVGVSPVLWIWNRPGDENHCEVVTEWRTDISEPGVTTLIHRLKGTGGRSLRTRVTSSDIPTQCVPPVGFLRWTANRKGEPKGTSRRAADMRTLSSAAETGTGGTLSAQATRNGAHRGTPLLFMVA